MREKTAKANWLIVRPGALGDAVLTLPALTALLAEGGRVTVLGQRRAWSFLRPDVAGIVLADIESAPWRGLFAAEGFAAGAASPLTGFTGAVLYLGSMREQVAEALARAGIADIIGTTPIRTEWAGVAEHAAERLLAPVARRLGCSLTVKAAGLAEDPMLALTEVEHARAWQGVVPAEGAAGLLALHPGSGGIAKRWPVEAYCSLAAIVQRRWGLHPLFLIGPAELELLPTLRSVPHSILAIDRPLRDVMALIAGSRAYVGNDSGVSHLAGRAVPSLVLFGPTDPRQWRPMGPMVRTLQADRGRLDTLPVAAVEAGLAELLGSGVNGAAAQAPP
ncbi:MAG: hypothetical protein HYR63_26820 [Proteobacteria bacterium]|nr:hypothetical protein [Pseudomonadota bacterium]MBI3498837.1 hypothetical protein [Pseudomonadota bacterium]